MDNRTFDVTAVGTETLKHVLAIAFQNAPGRKATHYVVESVNGKPTLMLCWHEEHGAQLLPFPLDEQGALFWIAEWLKNAEYPADSGWSDDVETDRGWRAYCGPSWSHVAGRHYAFLAVQPALALYGK